MNDINPFDFDMGKYLSNPFRIETNNFVYAGENESGETISGERTIVCPKYSTENWEYFISQASLVIGKRTGLNNVRLLLTSPFDRLEDRSKSIKMFVEGNTKNI